MRNRLILLAVLGLMVLAAACPRQGGDGAEVEPTAQEPAQPKVIVVKANPISTLEKMVNALNANDRAAYDLLVHPESPDRDALEARFAQFNSATGQLALEDVSLQSQEGTEARILYDFATNYTDPETKTAFETGTAVLHYFNEQWLIWQIQVRTGGPS